MTLICCASGAAPPARAPRFKLPNLENGWLSWGRTPSSCGMVGQRESQVIEEQLSRNEVQLIRGETAFADLHMLIVASAEGQRTVTASNILIV